MKFMDLLALVFYCVPMAAFCLVVLHKYYFTRTHK